MTESEYGSLYNQICALESRLQSSRAASWMRQDLRAEFLGKVRRLREDLYHVKQNEDKRNVEPMRQP